MKDQEIEPDDVNDSDHERTWVEYRGRRWLVVDARWDASGLEGGVGSHWHLTLTGHPDA